jgi:hypothetical protein
MIMKRYLSFDSGIARISGERMLEHACVKRVHKILATSTNDR